MGNVIHKGFGVICALALVFSGCDFKSMSSGVKLKIGYAINAEPSATPSPSASPTPVLLPPASITYSSNPASYKVSTAITVNTPMVTGGTPTSYTVTPTLPSGLNFNTTTGVITGTPAAVSAASNYTIKAMNSAGTAQVVLSIAVLSNVVAPSNLVYSSTAPTFTKGIAITSLTPTSQGGAPTAYSVSPVLPAGLSLNTTSGVISGTPTALSSATPYVITASNSAGATTATVTIMVVDAAPATLTYSSNPASYKVATAITTNSATTTGGTPASFSITPALPAGLAFSTTTGAITGTPAAVSAATNYTVKATNSAGSAQVILSIAVATNVVAPSSLTYSNLAPVFTKGTAITTLTPTNQGGTPTAYSISPALPSGLSFSTTTGAISGTPSAVLVMTPFVVTATNSAGSATVTLAITVKDIAPATITYGSVAIVYPKGIMISNNLPTITGGAVTSFSISPTLPAGLALSATSGAISGTPTAAVLPNSFTVTATNSGGSITSTIKIGVSDPTDPNATYTYIQTSLLTASCNYCHKTGGVPGAADYTTYTGLMTAVTAGSPLSSALYSRTAPGAASPMPPGGTITSVQSFAIMNWIALGAPNNSVVPSPTPSPSSAPIGSTLLVAGDERLRLANRTYIASALTDIFGTSAAPAITKLIMAPGYADVLGGPCNAYSDIKPINYGSFSQGSDCANAAGSVVAAIPMATTARGALITRACDMILSQDAAVLSAASLALGTTVTASTITTMNAAAITKAYDLFYFGRPMSTAVATDLLAIATAGENAMESWRFPLLALCYAPDWQVK